MVCPGAYGGAAAVAYVIPSVAGNINVGSVTWPPAHTACTTAGATGSDLLTAGCGERDLERRRGRVDLGPACWERAGPAEPVRQRRRHRHRGGDGAVVGARRRERVGDARRGGRRDRRSGHHTVRARRLHDRRCHRGGRRARGGGRA